jgi:hypothetical protein
LTEEKTLAQFDKWAKQITPYIIEADTYYNANSNTSTSKATPKNTWEGAASVLRLQVQGAAK